MQTLWVRNENPKETKWQWHWQWSRDSLHCGWEGLKPNKELSFHFHPGSFPSHRLVPVCLPERCRKSPRGSGSRQAAWSLFITALRDWTRLPKRSRSSLIYCCSQITIVQYSEAGGGRVTCQPNGSEWVCPGCPAGLRILYPPKNMSFLNLGIHCAIWTKDDQCGSNMVIS